MSKVKRESDAYDKGLDRNLYEKILSHCGHKSNVYRNEIVYDIMKKKANNNVVLELGSQLWIRWIEQFKIKPNLIHCINISKKELQHGIDYSNKTVTKPVFKIMDANYLEYENEQFDVVFGGGMLHHLEFERAVEEVIRVTKKDGIGIFVEPLNINLISKIIRYLTPKQRTIDETPLEKKHLNFLRNNAKCTFYYEQFFSIPLGLISVILFRKPDNFITKFAFHLDNILLRNFPSMGKYYRSVTILIEKN